VDKRYANTLSRGLDILACFQSGETILANKDFAARLNLDKSTVSRLTYTLAELGYLRQSRARGGYQLGAAVVSMCYPLLSGLNIRQFARSRLQQLANDVRGVATMSIRDHTAMVYIDTARFRCDAGPALDIGTSVPLVAGADGYAWLAQARKSDREAVLNHCRIRYPALAMEHAKSLRQAELDIANLGYCKSRCYLADGGMTISVPMPRPVHGETIVFSVGIKAERKSAEAVEFAGISLLRVVNEVDSRFMGLS